MGFLSRVLGPRGHRHARPAASRAGTKKGRRRTRQLRKALQRITRSLTRNYRSVSGKKLVTVYHHGTCTVNHRSRKAASRCRRTD
jgi:D-serine deaminase-like pyridoxal phosphate-dependent protein